jgi:FolB domain-containing protein
MIHIRDLALRCILGVYPHERREKQEVLINITMYADLSDACATDRIDSTVDYRTVKKQVIEMVESSSFQLVERLSGEIASVCLRDERVRRVRVVVDKPGALRFARSAAIEIVRGRE